MSTFAMTCTCGHEMKVDADSREEGVSKMQAMMNEEAIAKHVADNHPGEPMMQKSAVDAGIAQNLHAA